MDKMRTHVKMENGVWVCRDVWKTHPNYNQATGVGVTSRLAFEDWQRNYNRIFDAARDRTVLTRGRDYRVLWMVEGEEHATDNLMNIDEAIHHAIIKARDPLVLSAEVVRVCMVMKTHPDRALAVSHS